MTRRGVSQSNGLAHADIQVFAPAWGAGSLYPIAYWQMFTVYEQFHIDSTISTYYSAIWHPKWLTKLGNNSKYMQGNIRYMYISEVVIVARSLRSLEKILCNLTSDPTHSQIWNKSPPCHMTNAIWIGFRLGCSFRASTASEGRGEVCHNPTVWHMGTFKYSHQTEEPEVFILLPTDKCLQFLNSFTYIVLFPHTTVQSDIRNGWQN